MFLKLFLIAFTICQAPEVKLGKTILMKKVLKKIRSEFLQKLKQFVII